jgi:hypothetical protein
MKSNVSEWIKAAAEFDGGSFQISYEWKEMLTYWENGRGYVFDCGWGVDPGTVYVPQPGLWDEVVPDWLAGRRDLITERLSAHSGHTVTDDDRTTVRTIESWRLRQR